ncbi:MAG: PKD domain-containing protein [Bacteroidota bacterium]
MPLFSFSTHIVGGVLNYVYNGGSSYTIKLKLYRDCGPSAAAFPSSVVISVRGNNGATFSPNRDITMNLGTITTLPSGLSPCALAPNPMPCVQEGIYTITVNNLPANAGGYHLYYQITARNLSLTNLNGACNCIGESFYAYIPNNTVSANSNSNATFSLFPPLFLCVNKPFSFNHSATDADGDSLVYSMYTPYDGDNGTGSLDPVFSSNTAVFTPVSFLPGYTANNPLGPSPFNLNPVTGVITGTPGTVGQFVVGVKVKEYRNGVFISQTLRDFQFNVLNCPQPPPTLAISNFTLNNGCSAKLNAGGITSASATWNSIYPGATGAYNNYLSCSSACLNPTVVAVGAPPSYVDFLVCGTSTSCAGNFICDTFRVSFNAVLTVSINPFNPALCNGQTSTTLSAIGSGGTPPYVFLWNNVNPSQTINVGVGTYNIKLSDASGCPPAYNSVVVTSYTIPINANAGQDQTRCIQNPVAGLNATVVGATGGMWSGGTGTFSPNNTALTNLFYTPSPAELASGSATLFLTTTGNGNCPPDVDAVVIRYKNFTGTITASATSVKCYGGSTGSASVTIAGGSNPHVFLWSTVPSQNASVATGLSSGIYSVSITNSIGCSSQATVNITQPLPLVINSTVANVSCSGGSNGSISISPVGGTLPYSYNWLPGSQTTSAVVGLAAGVYTSVVTDSKNCVTSTTFSITQPSTLSIVFTQTNVSCFNGANAVINSGVTGGTPAYTYSWRPNGATSPNVSGLTPGIYTLTVRDNYNCALSKTVAISQPSAVVVTATVANETCSYLNNGSVTVNVTGGNSGYSYLWQPGSLNTSSISNLPAGNYSLTVTDASGCLTSTIISVNEPPVLSVSFINKVNALCYGSSTGSVTANTTGGTPNYTYSWSPIGVSSAVAGNIPAGTYTVFVTDSKTCQASNTVSISQPSLLNVTSTTNSVSCFGGNNGSIALNPNGGTAPYNYFWLPGGQSSSLLSGLVAGTYTANISDSRGCSVSLTYSVTQSPSISIALSQTNVSCFNGNNGFITSMVSGGSAPYSYNWAPVSGNLPSVSGLPSGIYTLTVNDNLNCAATKTAGIMQSPALVLTTTVVNESCDYLNNGSASATVTGGTPGYNFLWQPGSLTTGNIVGLASGSYTVQVTDLKGCGGSSVVTVLEPAPLSVSIGGHIPVSCFGGNNGAATATGSGGTANYSYTWTPGGANLNTVSNLSSGIYTVSVSDSRFCLVQGTVFVTQPASLTVSAVKNNISCFGSNTGSVFLMVGGGTSPYSYQWFPGGQTTYSVGGLTAGAYTASISDSKGCNTTAGYTIVQSSSVSIAFTTTNVSCFNGSNGSVNSLISGGTAPYTFLWSPSGATSQNTSGLQPGTHSLTVTDSNGCVNTKTVSISQPQALAISSSAAGETCNYLNNGKAGAIASGGSPAYSYTWMPGAMNTSSISNLSGGTYTVFVADQKGCVKSATVFVNEPSPLSVNFTNLVNVSCFGDSDGAVTANGAGGTPNYSYTWTPGAINSAMITNIPVGTYTVTVSDNNFCLAQNTVSLIQPLILNLIPSVTNVLCSNGSNGAISISASGGTAPYQHLLMPGNIIGANFSSLLPGTYSIITTDVKGCVNNTTININQPISISSVASFTNSGCLLQNGIASVSVTSGGIPPYTYNWLPTGGTNSVSANLYAGSYSVEVTDASGCISTKVVNISDINAPSVSILSTTNVSCFGGSNGALLASASGNGPLTYSWSPFGGNNLTAQNLSSGIYIIAVTDNAGCVGLATSTLVAEPPPIVVSVVPSNINCFGGNNGGGSAAVTGGVPGYFYNWQTIGIAGNSVTGLVAGAYSLTVADLNNCIQTATFSVSQPSAALNISVSSNSVSCFSGNNGSATVGATGGTAPYNYSWSPGNFTGASVFNLIAGNYSVVSTDLKGCISSGTFQIQEPSPVVLTTNSINSDCGLANGQASVLATGGTAPFTYTWLPVGGNNFTATGLIADIYTLNAVDANNCPAFINVSVSDNPAPLVSVVSTTDVSCFGGSNGAALAGVTGGSGPFTYLWAPAGGNAANATGLASGFYLVTVVSSNGCTVAASTPFISQPSPMIINLTTKDIACFGENGGEASASVFGGVPGYTLVWQPLGITSVSIAGLTAGGYSVDVTDANNCVQSSAFTISQPSSAVTLTLSSTAVSCFGQADGSLNAIASGGVSPYNFICQPGNFSGQNISNLAAGIYTITAIDMNGCGISQTVTVSQPQPLVVVTAGADSNCGLANGQVSVSASGGTAPFYYLWAGFGTNAVLTAVPAGSYNVVVTDANNCSALATQTISDHPAPFVSISSTTNVSCFGGSDGSATAMIIGGTGPFTYSWSPAGGSAATATSLIAGSYNVLVNAANGCTSSASGVLITEPTQILLNLSTSPVDCYGGASGSATVMAGGGIPGYSFTWLPGNTTGSVVSGLSANSYTLQTKDFNNCIQSSTFSITQPLTALTASISSINQVSCFGGANGSGSATVTGGTPGYNYSWSPVNSYGPSIAGLPTGNYSLSVSDLNGCTTSVSLAITQPTQALSATATPSAISCFGGSNGSAAITVLGGTPAYACQWYPTGGTTQTMSALFPGNYTVAVKDVNNCEAQVVFAILEPSVINGTLIVTPASCGFANGTISSQVSGGTGPYTYLWSSGSSTNSVLSGLLPGFYSVIVTDAANCTKTFSATIINVPGPVLSTGAVKNVSCFNGNNGTATVNISQGTAPFTMNWTPFGGNSVVGTSLIAGTYTAVVTDALGCLSSTTLTVNEPAAMSISINTIANVSCFNGSNGSVSVLVTGGTPTYTYSWSLFRIGPVANSLPAGGYSLIVTDANKCSAAISMNVLQPPALSSSVTGVTDPLCFGGNGGATILASGGKQPYTYLWTGNPVQTGNSLTNSPAGSYTVYIKDANNCPASNSVTIKQPSQVITKVSQNDTVCIGKPSFITASALGGAGNYNYSWQPVNVINSGTLNFTPTNNIVYVVSAFDQNGCFGLEAKSHIVLYNLTASDISIVATSPVCIGNSATIRAQSSGNTGPLSFSWNNNLGNGPGTFTVKPNQATTYAVNISNSCGLTLQDSVRIELTALPTVGLISDTNRVCAPGSIRFFDRSSFENTGDPIISWNWNFGDGTISSEQHPLHNFVSAGTYTVNLSVVTDRGCTNSSSASTFSVIAYAPPIASFSVNSNFFDLPYDVLICTNQSTGAATYNWILGVDGVSTEENPRYLLQTIGEQDIQLIATSVNGCKDTASVNVTTRADVIFPNAFTPNTFSSSGGSYDLSSLTNDLFFPYTSGVVEFNFQIFNRWGELIFESQDLKTGWDGYYRGKLCQTGVYMWKAKILLNNGKVFKQVGNVTLLR